MANSSMRNAMRAALPNHCDFLLLALGLPVIVTIAGYYLTIKSLDGGLSKWPHLLGPESCFAAILATTTPLISAAFLSKCNCLERAVCLATACLAWAWLIAVVEIPQPTINGKSILESYTVSLFWFGYGWTPITSTLVYLLIGIAFAAGFKAIWILRPTSCRQMSRKLVLIWIALIAYAFGFWLNWMGGADWIDSLCQADYLAPNLTRNWILKLALYWPTCHLICGWSWSQKSLWRAILLYATLGLAVYLTLAIAPVFARQLTQWQFWGHFALMGLVVSILYRRKPLGPRAAEGTHGAWLPTIIRFFPLGLLALTGIVFIHISDARLLLRSRTRAQVWQAIDVMQFFNNSKAKISGLGLASPGCVVAVDLSVPGTSLDGLTKIESLISVLELRRVNSNNFLPSSVPPVNQLILVDSRLNSPQLKQLMMKIPWITLKNSDVNPRNADFIASSSQPHSSPIRMTVFNRIQMAFTTC